MKISIITTVYNAEEYIRGTIESVLSQSGVDIEYIITDGGSTDKTTKIAGEYSQVILKSEPDKGIYDGMNNGIREATGDIIGILNAGDLYSDGSLTIIKQAALDYLDCGVFHGRLTWTRNGQELLTVGQKVLKSSLKLSEMPVCHPTTFIRRAVYEKYGIFDPSYKIAADHKLIHLLIKEGVKFHFIDEVIAYMESDGASAIHRAIKRDEVLKTIRDHDGGKVDIMRVWYEYYLKVTRDKALECKWLPHRFIRPLYRKIRAR